MKIIAQLQREARKDGLHMVRINLRDAQGNQRRYPCHIHIKADAWDDKARKVRFGKHRDASVFNNLIQAKVAAFERQAIEHPEWSLQQHLDAVDGGAQPGPLRLLFVQAAVVELDRNPPKSWQTRRTHEYTLAIFDRTCPKVELATMSREIMVACKRAWEAQGTAMNTIAGRLKRINSLYKKVCMVHGLDAKNLLAGVGATEKYNDAPVQLLPDEVRALQDMLPNLALASEVRALAMWLFSLYSGGIRFGDLCRLTTDNIRDGRLVYGMSKVDRKVRNVILVPEAIALTERCREGKMLFGVRGADMPTPQQIAASCAYVNRKLKIIAKRCGINKPLRTHNARHSFANLALLNKLDDRAIQAIMGLSDKAFKHYRGRLQQDDVDQGLSSVVSSLLPR